MLLRHLRYLLAVVEQGGFTRAAEALHLSQPTLSQQVRQLEERLGFDLLDRSGRSVRATDEGEVYLQHVRRAFAELAAAEQAVADVRGLGRGLLRLGITPTFTSYLVGPLMEAFGARHPGIRTMLQVMTQDGMETALEADRLDLGIAFGQVRSAEIEVTPLFDERLRLVVAEAHALDEREMPATRLSTAVAFALLSEDFATRRHIDRYFSEQEIRPTVLFEGNSVDAIIEVVRRGRLATILPEAVAREQPGLRAIALSPAIAPRAVGLLQHRGAYRSAAVRAFIATARDVLAENAAMPSPSR
ncbi:MAG TPA: transcriptional regulator CynR [Aliidongia sp.]|nr:transcriptional regulator CynR [Aliidongia sp.]